MKIEDIVFDDDDKNLFLIDDLQLKADAIRYSILPKLEIINNELIYRVSNFYDLDFYQNYSTLKSPHFRLSKTQRKEPTKRNYTSSSISITGQRKADKWKGLDKGTSTIPHISPSLLSIDLDAEGINTHFVFNYPKGFTQKTYKRFYDFFTSRHEKILSIANKCGLKYLFKYVDVFSFKEDLELRFNDKDYDVIFFSEKIVYPINYSKINELLYINILFFPILNSCVEIALGENDIFDRDIELLESKIFDFIDMFDFDKSSSDLITLSESKEDVIKKVEKKIKVQAGIRWQVFKRDNWRCVACGRSAEDNVILHIDHITPRSKGGTDEMNNYQTLCEACNIGKSNKDNTDLRSKTIL